MQQQLYLICYDIRDDNNRLKVSDLLEMYGGSRRNKSVFEIMLTSSELSNLWQKIIEKSDEDTDSILCYCVCIDCYATSLSFP